MCGSQMRNRRMSSLKFIVRKRRLESIVAVVSLLLVLQGMATADTKDRRNQEVLETRGEKKHKYTVKGWPSSALPNPSTKEGASACGRSTVKHSSSVCDPDGLISRKSADQMDEMIDAARKQVGLKDDETSLVHDLQIAVAIVNKMGPADKDRRELATRYARQVHDNWGLGSAGIGNGVLLFVSKEDRQVYISTGRLARNKLPDSVCNQIVDVMRPVLRQGYFDQALLKGVQEIITRISEKKTFWARYKNIIIFSSIVAFFLATASYKQYQDRNRKDEFKKAMSLLKRIEETAGKKLEAARKGSNDNARYIRNFRFSPSLTPSSWQCPVCLEDYAFPSSDNDKSNSMVLGCGHRQQQDAMFRLGSLRRRFPDLISSTIFENFTDRPVVFTDVEREIEVRVPFVSILIPADVGLTEELPANHEACAGSAGQGKRRVALPGLGRRKQ
ncbi:hypothetical protein GUITHDRAFT_166971 [Guillardia theta CCMP2712]|uniref:TPM domain-containing protein n=1 Tax=Guillardia theta (strain CCMP2712) TaxID=905079 RepID=L1I404_GUITC|nr:hypothetical protein GUITHDRAFT_166971 [Guillardia theta CCMP2712]EKX30966.1 hypothetical protein GUITHDRAFT_166971 [Guillardia theta CCMP2712]|eukprot:XP_005817946.1 hypothetical protein GUITHDRAFT_166971 [Guillardia theta CCMP2712]